MERFPNHGCHVDVALAVPAGDRHLVLSFSMPQHRLHLLDCAAVGINHEAVAQELSEAWGRGD